MTHYHRIEYQDQGEVGGHQDKEESLEHTIELLRGMQLLN